MVLGIRRQPRVNHCLDPSNPSIGQSHFDASGMFAAGQDVTDDPGHGSAGALVGFEDDVDAGAGDHIPSCWNTRNWGQAAHGNSVVL
jgi:hypothetical protein